MSDSPASEATDSVKKILVPTDFSQNSEKACRRANAAARRHGASVDLAHVVSMNAEGAIYGPVYFPAYEREFIAASDEKLKALRQSFFDEDVAVNTVTLSGAPASEIERFAKERGSDLIVISTHGNTGLKHLLLGSVAENVVRRAPCSVLVVKERPEKSDDGD